MRPAVNAGGVNTAVIGAGNPGLAVGTGTTGQNVRSNVPSRPNPGTEVGLDIAVPKPNRPGTGGGSGQNYRDWAADLTGAGEPFQNQPSRTPAHRPADNGGKMPNFSIAGCYKELRNILYRLYICDYSFIENKWSR